MRNVAVVVASLVGVLVATGSAAQDLGAGWRWLAPTPQGADLLAGAYGGGVSVMVGRDGTAVVSDDGLAWRYVDPGVRDTLVDVVWTGERFVAAGGLRYSDRSYGGRQGVILSSPDGVEWTVRHTRPDAMFHSLCWNGHEVVAAGFPGVVATSRDGIGWRERAAPDGRATAAVMALSAIGGDCVGFGWGAVVQERPREPLIFRSPDGRDWAASWPAGLVTTAIFDLASDGRHIVATGWGDGSFTALTTTDGQTWSERRLDADHTGALVTVAAHDGGWLGLGRDFSAFVSSDGLHWTPWGEPVIWPVEVFDIEQWPALAVRPGGVATGGFGGALATKTDGADWQVVWTPPAFRGDFVDAAVAGTRLVAVGDLGQVAITDDVGSPQLEQPFDSEATITVVRRLRDAWWLADLDGRIASSADGAVWIERLPPADGTWFLDLAADGDTVVAVGGRVAGGWEAGPVAAVSTGGSDWQITGRLPFAWSAAAAVVAHDGRFISFGDDLVSASVDGLSWDYPTTLSGMSQVDSADAAVGRIVVAGIDQDWCCGAIGSSVDGVAWHVTRYPGTGEIGWVRWTGERFVAVAEDEIFVSPDGDHWQRYELPGGMRTTCVVEHAGALVGLGPDGTVVRRRLTMRDHRIVPPTF